MANRTLYIATGQGWICSKRTYTIQKIHIMLNSLVLQKLDGVVTSSTNDWNFNTAQSPACIGHYTWSRFLEFNSLKTTFSGIVPLLQDLASP